MFSALLVMTQAWGYFLQVNQSTTVGGLLLCLGIRICFAPPAAYGFLLLARLMDNLKPVENNHPRRVFRISFAVILLGWLPVFLAYYPGLFTYDVGIQIPQILSGGYSGRHPLLHTLFIGGFYQLGALLGNINLGIAAANLIQMIIMAAIFSWFIRYLYLLQAPKFLWLTL